MQSTQARWPPGTPLASCFPTSSSGASPRSKSSGVDKQPVVALTKQPVVAPVVALTKQPVVAPVVAFTKRTGIVDQTHNGCRPNNRSTIPAEGAAVLWQLNGRGPMAGWEDGSDGQAAKASWNITCITNGGTGARPGLDGLSATAYPSGVRGTPIEINEAIAPLIFHRKEYRTDSAGAGVCPEHSTAVEEEEEDEH